MFSFFNNKENHYFILSSCFIYLISFIFIIYVLNTFDLSINVTKQSSQKNTSESTQTRLIVASVDGYAYRYIRQFRPSTLLREYYPRILPVRPSFPSKTFVNHYSIATGLFPSSHGIVANHFPSFSHENAKVWGGEPLWITAEKQGVSAGVIMWPGVSARPSKCLNEPFSSSLTCKENVQKTLNSDCDVIFVYLTDKIDHEGHNGGKGKN